MFPESMQPEYEQEYDKKHDRNENETEDGLHQTTTSHPRLSSGLVCSLEKNEREETKLGSKVYGLLCI